MRAQAVGCDDLNRSPKQGFAEEAQVHEVMEGRLSRCEFDVKVHIALWSRLVVSIKIRTGPDAGPQNRVTTARCCSEGESSRPWCSRMVAWSDSLLGLRFVVLGRVGFGCRAPDRAPGAVARRSRLITRHLGSALVATAEREYCSAPAVSRILTRPPRGVRAFCASLTVAETQSGRSFSTTPTWSSSHLTRRCRRSRRGAASRHRALAGRSGRARAGS